MLTEDDILLICKGNIEAAGFVNAFIAYCHTLDDVVDKDKPVTDEQLVRASLGFIEQLLMNPWAKERQALLWPMIVTGANAWLDSNEWQQKNPSDADVIKGVYHEVIWFVAYLCGGWNHLRWVTTTYRKYDHEKG